MPNARPHTPTAPASLATQELHHDKRKNREGHRPGLRFQAPTREAFSFWLPESTPKAARTNRDTGQNTPPKLQAHCTYLSPHSDSEDQQVSLPPHIPSAAFQQGPGIRRRPSLCADTVHPQTETPPMLEYTLVGRAQREVAKK